MPTNVSLRPLKVDYGEYRRQVIFDCFKWDPQVGDINTICDHAAVLSSSTASQLADWSESLARETMQLEDALSERTDLFRELGLPRSLTEVLTRKRSKALGEHVRVMRFDFHPTPTGWAISEVNSDVPGGFSEASALPRLAARFVSGTRVFGDVGGTLLAALTGRIGSRRRVAFVHATSYSDDRQVMQYLASRFEGAGHKPVWAAPDHLRWRNGNATAIADGQEGPVDAVVRFYPAEWLPQLPRSSNWQDYFAAGTPTCNHPRAVLTQSKRLPLIWDRLGIELPTWRRLLPETCDHRQVRWKQDPRWVIKPALGRVGDGIAWRNLLAAKEWRSICVDTMFSPRCWVAQRRFESQPLATSSGERHLCIGSFTVDGKAAGFYGRLSASPRIDHQAQDIAVLVDGAEVAV
ncbi:MAG: glutathionylspermidine synthase family protein [Nevskiales bacterium]